MKLNIKGLVNNLVRIAIVLFCLSEFSNFVSAQTKQATIEGVIVDERHSPIGFANILFSKDSTLIGQTNDSGYFLIHVPSGRFVTITYTSIGKIGYQKEYLIRSNRPRRVRIVLKDMHELGFGKRIQNDFVKNNNDNKGKLKDVTVSTRRKDIGELKVDAKLANINPSPINGIEGLIKTFVGSNNELTSQYSVRGGNYDENLIYVNGYEIYRPFLISSGQQEGLSFINPDLTDDVKFFNGGFSAKYGDKMSSVLDIKYKKPTESSGSVNLGLIEQGLHFEGRSKNEKFTYLAGLRHKDNRNILAGQETKGSYIPSSSDLQGLFTWQLNNALELELLADYSQTKFTFFPLESQLTASVFSPLYGVSSYVADIAFDGSEKDKYGTNFVGLTLNQTINKKLKLKWLISRYADKEQQYSDITGSYTFGTKSADPSGGAAWIIDNILAEGVNHEYSHNDLDISVYRLQNNGYFKVGTNYLQWGLAIERQGINSILNENPYISPNSYTLPYKYTPPSDDVIRSDTSFNVLRSSGFLQDNIYIKRRSDLIFQLGVRYNYNNMNKEFLLSPRAGISFKPGNWKRNVTFRSAIGVYNQPPFYREMQRLDGSVNAGVKSQKSWQIDAGMDYNFEMYQRPAKFTADVYYKNMRDVNPYDIDNVRIRYYGVNDAVAYAMGMEARLFTQFVKDAESWISIGIMNTKENINNDYYFTYRNVEGEEITSTSQDITPYDSTRHSIGWLRRPTDRRLTFGMFFQDYLKSNKNLKVYLNTIYGSNLPFNLPGSSRYRNGLMIPAYLRVDMGIGALLYSKKSRDKLSLSSSNGLQHIWMTLEVYNLIDKSNTISYTLIKDDLNNTYAMPNRLTPRLFNVKLTFDW